MTRTFGHDRYQYARLFVFAVSCSSSGIRASDVPRSIAADRSVGRDRMEIGSVFVLFMYLFGRFANLDGNFDCGFADVAFCSLSGKVS